jgi:hypothetical protein
MRIAVRADDSQPSAVTSTPTSAMIPVTVKAPALSSALGSMAQVEVGVALIRPGTAFDRRVISGSCSW